MNILGFEIKKQAAKHDPYDLRNHPNAFPLNKAQQDKIKGILIDLVKMTQNLTKQDVDSWRQAWQRAIFIQNPKRIELLRHYRDALIDLHLSGCIMQRKLATMQKVFKIVDKKTGEEDEAKTLLFKKRWFRQFCNLVLDTPYFGHSLIQFGDVIIEPEGRKFSDVTLVAREHVMPEFHCITKDQYGVADQGIDYTQPPISDWCIAVGEPNDLGLLLKLVPQTISCRHMEAFWDQFGELFGMPIRVGKTNSRNEGERSKITNMLENMGTAAWGLFPDGTDIEIKETTRGDAFEVYDKRIERAENRISVAVLGQTMTIKDGSSKAQGQVHLEIFEKVCKSDANLLTEVINEDLFPLLNKHGFGLEGFEFEFDESKEYTPEELSSILGVLCQYYEVDEDYINDKIQIPVTGKKTTPPPDPNKPDPNKPDPNKKQKPPVNFFD